MIGWAANVFIIIGIILLGYQLRSGFIFGVIGSLVWAARGFETNQYDLVSIEILIAAIQTFSYYNWGKYERSDNPIYTRADKQQ